MIKQRKDSANIYDSKGRNDLATSELNQIKIISQFLPKQLAESEIVDIVDKIIVDLNASGMKDMGKVMSLASQEMMGKADGKTISSIVNQIIFVKIKLFLRFGPVVQLDRMSDFGSDGWGFESSWVTIYFQD